MPRPKTRAPLVFPTHDLVRKPVPTFRDHALTTLVVVERDGIELESVIDQLVAELARDFRLHALDLGRAEFDHFAAAQVDQVVVMGFRGGFVTRAPLAEIVPLDDAGILEQAHGAVYGGNGNPVVDLGAAPIELLDVGMIVGPRQDARDGAALLGHAHAFGGAQSLDISPVGDALVGRGHDWLSRRLCSLAFIAY